MITYGRHLLDAADEAAVLEVLRSDWLTTGSKVKEFEQALASAVETRHGVAVSSGTAALHCAMFALGIGPGDEVIVPPLTFAASANCILYQGGVPVFADVDPETLLVDPLDVERKITPRTRAILGVDYAGQPCDWSRLRDLARLHGLNLVDDACHALGASCGGRAVGALADISVFSFHPVKHITTGEGGMAVTDDESLAARMTSFRNHGIDLDHRQRESRGSWQYEMHDLGFNYRLTDIQCALGSSQLRKLPSFLERRREIAGRYGLAFAAVPLVKPLTVRSEVLHAFHLYVIRCDFEALGRSRAEVFKEFRARNIAVNVHYMPVYLHPYYRERFGMGPGLCPKAEEAYENILTLPLHAAMTDSDVSEVCAAVRDIFAGE